MAEQIGLIDVDGHNYPNLALMKISAWHKTQGNKVEWVNFFKHYDKVYMAKVFTDIYSPDEPTVINADLVYRGGTGYGLCNKLPDEIEHIYPDYSLYGINNTAYGFLTRGCPRACGFCIVADKEGRASHKVADLNEWHRGQRYIELLDPNILASKDWPVLLRQLADSKAKVNISQGLDARLLTKESIEALNKINLDNVHFAYDFMSQSEAVKKGLRLYKKHGRKIKGFYGTVYVLTNYDTSTAEDLERIYWLRAEGYDPYVMVYDKPTAPKITKELQRWCNFKAIFRSIDFAEYKKVGG